MCDCIYRDAQKQSAIAEKSIELEELRLKVEELTVKKNQRLQKLRHTPTDPVIAKLLKDVSVGGE